ncbi:MAG TPA: hypothetical protein VHE09_01895 [Rhizomicrobium sp.]|nr:hypothetical protein [Rhizomicrobium sp.]
MAQTERSSGPVEVSRDKLFEQVWQTPMQRLAEQYGITGNGLAKICDRLKVPYPPRGYWAKVSAGKNVVKYRLPSPEADTHLSITIRPTLPTAKVEPGVTTEITARTESLRSEIEAAASRERLSRPHPIIEGWLSDHARRRREARQQRDPWRKKLDDHGDFSPSDHRRHRILDALFKAIEGQKGKVKQNERHALCAVVNGEEIEFQLREKLKQTRRVLTPEEKRRTFSTSDWKQVLEPTGKLAFSVRTYLPSSMRREWLENDKVSMEALLPEIVSTLIAAGPLLVEQRRQREQADRERQVAEMKRYEEARKGKLDDNRWRRFVEFARAHRDIGDAHIFLNTLKGAKFDPSAQITGGTIGEWVAWAEMRLAESDPANSGIPAIFEDIAKTTEWSYRD